MKTNPPNGVGELFSGHSSPPSPAIDDLISWKAPRPLAVSPVKLGEVWVQGVFGFWFLRCEWIVSDEITILLYVAWLLFHGFKGHFFISIALVMSEL
jgi:hypothetical protein